SRAPTTTYAHENPATEYPAASPALTNTRRVRWRSILFTIRPHRRLTARRTGTIDPRVGRGKKSCARGPTRAIVATGFVLVLAIAATGARAKEQQTDQATKVPPGAKWSQATILSSGGVKLHADVLRP